MARVVVIGLGIFGANLTKKLYEAGIEVVAIDKNREAIQQIKDFCSKAILADSSDRNVLESIGIEEDDKVVVSFGEDLAASVLTTLHLRQLKVKDIIVKAPNEEHKIVLEMVGANTVIIPEKEVAEKVAKSIISPNILDYLPVSEDYMICEIAPPSHFIGKSLEELRLRSKYNVYVIAVKDVLTDKISMPTPKEKIKDSDILIVIGRSKDIEKLR